MKLTEFTARLDERILALFTKASHKFQTLTGRTNFFLAKIFILVSMTGVALCTMNYWFGFLGAHLASVAQVAVGMLMVSVLAWDVHRVDKADQRLFSGTRTMATDILPAHDRGFRMLLLLLFMVGILLSYQVFFLDRSGVLLFKIIHHFFPLELAIAAYFSAVVPLPPRQKQDTGICGIFLGRLQGTRAGNQASKMRPLKFEF